MKKLFMTFFLIPFMTFAQTEHYGELIFTLINPGSSWNVTFKLEAISERWDRNFELTENYEIVTVTIQSSPNQTVAYFDHVYDPWAGINPIFAFGLYKISAIENDIEQAHFYMDWRTSDASPFGDVYFKYDVANKRFRDENNTQTIDKTYQTIWNLLGQIGSTLQTSGFEDYWDNCLAVIPNTDNHPMLVWGPYPYNVGIYEYNIYRDYGGWDILETVDSEEFNYIDETLSLTLPGGQMGTDVYYYVKGVYTEKSSNPIETSASNTVVVNVPGGDIDKKTVSNNIENQNYNLKQNYPNPFNPITIINYSLPISGLVTIKVFDILGREVDELVNEQKEAGTHIIKFDASNLTSGIYLYRLTAGKYSYTRKLILQK